MGRMSYIKQSEVITEEGYTLAPFLLRIAATLVDMTFFVASAILIFFLMTTTLFPTFIDVMGSRDAKDRLTDYQVNSGLVYQDEKNVLSDISSEHYQDYEEAVRYYYLSYELEGNPLNPEPLNFDIPTYNQKILLLPESDEYVNKSSYYDFYRDEEGNADCSKLGVLKESLFDENGLLKEEASKSLLAFYREAYGLAQDSLMSRPYYVADQNLLNKGYIIVEAIALYLPFLIFYVVIPMSNIPSQTLGKKWMKLALADSSSGVALEKWKLALRTIPFVLGAMVGIIFNDLIFTLTTAIVLLLVSSGLMVFTKKRRSLHDYIAFSVVIREEDLMVKQPQKEEELKENA